MYALKAVEKLVSRYGTCNPWHLCEYLNIHILYHDLGKIRGYYIQNRREKFIVISQNLRDREKRIVCAHELGHAVLHPNLCTPFYTEHTLFSKDKYEMQANHFAAFLILAEYSKEDLQDMTAEQLSVITGLPVDFFCKMQLSV